MADLRAQIGELYYALQQHMRDDPEFKIMVFFVTARQTQFMAELFNALGVRVLETHSRKSQGHRTKVANEFRTTSKRILFSSDVSARGLDYDNVTLVVQYGSPSDRAQYVHRIGRTARAGKSGGGLLLICPWERKHVMKMLNDLPLEPAVSTLESSGGAADFERQLAAAEARVSDQTKSQCYQAWLGCAGSEHARALQVLT